MGHRPSEDLLWIRTGPIVVRHADSIDLTWHSETVKDPRIRSRYPIRTRPCDNRMGSFVKRQGFLLLDESKASAGAFEGSAGSDFAAEHREPDGPDDTENEGHDKVGLRADLP